MTKRRIDAVEVCEGILRKEIENNEKNNIWPSINATVRVLLRQSRTMAPVYGVLGIFRPKTTKCSGGRAVRGLQRGITFR